MKISRMFVNGFSRFIPYYDDTEETPEEKAAREKAEKEEADKNKGGEEKKFSQKDLDKAINQRFKKEREANEKMLKQLEAIQKDGLTPEAKEQLEKQIEALGESLQTKEQTAAQKMSELSKKHEAALKTATETADTWKNRYHKSSIERAILDAANGSEAETPEQLVLMFGPAARLEEEVDAQGKGTGNFVPKMKFKGIDAETKKPADLDLPVGEAIAHMRENGLHSNLFKHQATPGTGKGGSGTGGGNKGGHEMPIREKFGTDTEFQNAYNGWRDTHNVDGSVIPTK